MANRFSKSTRSYIMSRIRGKDTKPECIVRSVLHRNGFRFRNCCKSLPGTPDIVLKKHLTVVFVHGCFWHQHAKCGQNRVPKSNKKYWIRKFERNKTRDRQKYRALLRAGWRVIIVWECQIKNIGKFSSVLLNKLNSGKMKNSSA